MSTEQKILKKTQQLFFRLGIKSVTMDDIAQELGMSKKTLYKYVDNKSDLVYKVLQNHLLVEEKFIETLENSKLNGIDTIVEIIKNVIKSMSNMPLAAIYDLQKYYPESWALLEEFKSCSIVDTMENILKKGKKEGLFRTEIKEDILSKFYMISVEGILDPFNFTAHKKYDFKEIYLEYIIYHLHGIVSDEGHEYLKTIKL